MTERPGPSAALERSTSRSSAVRTARSFAPVVACALVSIGVAGLTGRSSGAAHLLAVLGVSLFGLLWAAAGVWRERRELRLAGALVVGALALWLVGAAGWDLNVLVLDEEPFPSWTDAFFLASYPALIAAALTMVRRRETTRDVAALIDAAIITVGVGVVTYAFVLADYAGDESSPLLSRVVSVSYPLCDVLVVGVVARMLLGSTARSRAGLVLVSALCSLLLADVCFVVAVFAGVEQAYDGWIDAPYMMFFLLMGLAFQQRDVPSLVHARAAGSQRLGWLRLAAMGASALLAPVTLLVSDVADEPLKVRGGAIGAAIMFLLAMARMSQLVRAVERNSELLEVQARTDSLTGLPNRRTFDFELQRAVETSASNVLLQPLSIAMIDLDRFKAYNDTFGHGGGDHLLQELANTWRMALRELAPAATLARYGGEEFALILPGIGEESAAALLRDLLPLTPDAQTFSAGVAEHHVDETPAGVLRRADLRLYEAKAAGRARIVAGGVPRETFTNEHR